MRRRAIRPYPKSVCTSVNHVVCHGVPGDKKLKAGDIINIDVTVIKDGYHGDTSRMFYVGQPSVQAPPPVRDHLRVHVARDRRGARRRAGWAISGTRSRAGPKTTAAAWCANSAATASAANFTRSRRYCTTGAPAPASYSKPAMTFTVEPMINAGRADIRQLADGWTIVTKDHSLSAQWSIRCSSPPTDSRCWTRSAGAPAPPEFP